MMLAFVISWPFAAGLSIALVAIGLLVYALWPTWDAEELAVRAPSPPRVPHPLDELVAYDAADPLDPALVAAIPLEEIPVQHFGREDYCRCTIEPPRDTIIDPLPGHEAHDELTLDSEPDFAHAFVDATPTPPVAEDDDVEYDALICGTCRSYQSRLTIGEARCWFCGAAIAVRRAS